MRLVLFLITSVSALSITPGASAAEGTVHGLQPPAWVVRGPDTRPIFPGTELRHGDRIHTGPGARVELHLADASRFQVGEEARIAAPSLAMRQMEEGEMLHGSFDILKGAFRYTTGVIGGAEKRRDLTFNVGVATVGIRGTDVWGRKGEAEDIIVLIEGHVELTMPDESMTMDQPLMAMRMAGPSHGMTRITREELDALAAETDMRPDAARITVEGTHVLVLMSLAERVNADRLLGRLHEAGYPAEIVSVDLPRGRFHRVVVTGLASRDDATKLAATLDGRFGIRGTWIR